jgi:methyl-accepting chemotaxis protein
MSTEEIQSRLSFMGMDDTQRATLASLQPLVKSLIGGALDRFYSVARATPQTKAFFADENQMMKAKKAQEAHWLRIARGQFDEEFDTSVHRIGSVHARIGLAPRWYVGAYALVLEELIRGIGRRSTPLRRFLGLFREASDAEASIAITKAALIDMEMSISIYFEQLQVEQDKAGKALAEREAELNILLGVIAESAEGIRTGSSEITQASEDLARRTEGNAASLEETSAALVQIDGRLKATSQSSTQTVARADQAIATVNGGRATAEEAVQAMGRVSDSAKGIDSVIEGLDKIAFQTRVLAMNAAVEAGRAGDAGRGFAVVADLVSALAMRAEEEAKRARDQLTLTQTDIVTAVQAVQKVDGALANISSDVDEVHKLLGTMADDASAQSTAITQISAAIGAMDQSTQQNAAMVEQTSAAARNLTAEVTALADQAAMFKTEEAHVRRTPPQRVAPPQPAQRQAANKPASGYRSPIKALPAAVARTANASAGHDDWNAF